jgi:hypothetical protein
MHEEQAGEISGKDNTAGRVSDKPVAYLYMAVKEDN